MAASVAAGSYCAGKLSSVIAGLPISAKDKSRGKRLEEGMIGGWDDGMMG
jgi:hypothetical protein